MPFRRSDNRVFSTELVLPGYGKLRRLSLGTTRLNDARAMESAIREVARRALSDPRLHSILDALQGHEKALGPADVLIAIRGAEGPETGLERLLRRIHDPSLADAIDKYLATVTSPSEKRAAVRVLYAMPKGSHLSDLADAEVIQRVLRAVRQGRKPTSVRREDAAFIGKLLAWRYGKAERTRIMADVTLPTADDRRRLREGVVTPAALRRLCEALDNRVWHDGDRAAALYVRIAMSTGAEVRPLSECLVSDWARLGPGGRLLLRGTKRAKRGGGSRDRELTLPAVLAEAVDGYAKDVEGRERYPTERLFPLTHARFWTLFSHARRDAGLMGATLDGDGQPTPLRPHDLRRVFYLYAEKAGLSVEVIGMGGLGHDTRGSTDRYGRRQVTVSPVQAESVAEALGL